MVKNIIHYADIQVKIRDKNLIRNFKKSLIEIEEIIFHKEADIVVLAGDIFEYEKPNEEERRLIYDHIINILKIDTVKEFVIMLGNHDYDDKNQRSDNPISILANIINQIEPELAIKINYLKKSEPTPSITDPKIVWLPYSLEDKRIAHKLLYKDISFLTEDKLFIAVFHNILYEYVEFAGLPVRNKSRLMKRGDFLMDYILAGDIHEAWDYNNFYYPGSTIERNHGEGDYIKFKNNKFTIHNGFDKSVLLHKFDMDKLEKISSTKINIKNNLKYLTIDLSTIDTIDNKVLFDGINKYFDRFDYVDNDLIIKLKLSVENQKHRKDLLNALKGFSRFDIEVKDIKSIDKKLLNSIEDEQAIEDNNYVLTKEKIVSLFADGLQTLDDGSSIYKEVKDDVIDTFASNLDLFYDAEKSYHIDFLDVEFNMFQILGPNKINLDIEGLTRIKGSNKIGKTTLFNLLYFMRYGKVYHNLGDRNKKYNNSLVFNNSLPDNNEIKIKLSLLINGLRVDVIRKLYRDWKKDVTLKQKLSKNNIDYIAAIKHYLIVNVYDKNDVNKINHTLKDNEAMILLERWFADSVDNLLIINDFKLKSLLNLQPDKLEELLLNYIGNNFIKSMQKMLPSFKEKIIKLPRQEKTDIVLHKEISELEEYITKANTNIEISNTSLNASNKLLQNLKDELEQINDDLTNLGNVPEVIKIIENKIIEFDNFINNFEYKEYLKVPEIFNLPKPELNYEEFNSLKNEMEEKIKSNRDKIQKIQNDLIDKFNKKINELSTTINKKIVEYRKNLLLQQDDIQKEIQNHQYYVLLNAKIDEVHKRLAEYYRKEAELNNEYKNNLAEKQRLEDELKTGVCSMCGQKLPDKDIDIQTIKTRQVTLVNNEKTLSDQIEENRSQIKATEFLVKTLQEVLNNKEVQSFEFIPYEVLNDLETKNQKVQEIKKQLNEFELMPISEKSFLVDKSNYEHYLKVKDYLDKIYKFDGVNDVDGLMKEAVQYAQEVQQLKLKIENVNETIRLYENKLAEYNEKYRQYLLEVSRINQANLEITENNKKLDETKAVKIEYEKRLNYEKTKLKEFQVKNELKQTTTTKISELEEKIKDVEYKKLHFENAIKTWEKEIEDKKQQIQHYHDWIYQKTKYKYFQLMINKILSKSIFNYYRETINYKFNELLEDVSFDLEWNNDGKLYKVYRNDDGELIRINVIGASGMETTFLGLSLIYSINELNQKNKLSHIFVDEISGKLNSGEGNDENQDKTNYQEMLVKLLTKFVNTKIFIVDHVIYNLFETATYKLYKENNQTFFELEV